MPIFFSLNFSLKRGQLCAVVGHVGSGKSSMISALLGEMTKYKGTIDTQVILGGGGESDV